MFALPSFALLGLALLAAPVEATERLPLPAWEAGTRYIELTADAPRKTPEVCIRPELSLTLFFDTKMARVEVEGRERFRRVKVVDDPLTLVASEALHDGERVSVTVYFEGDAAPASATFVLVVHPSQAEQQVEVSRHERTVPPSGRASNRRESRPSSAGRKRRVSRPSAVARVGSRASSPTSRWAKRESSPGCSRW